MKRFKNRFQKFYHLNKDRINKARRSLYKDKKKEGTCVRCERKALSDINFCRYHREKQRDYNSKRY